MSLAVHVAGRRVATLDARGDFGCVMRYDAGVDPEDLASLTMHVRAAPYEWDDVLHPFFQMNLPEGYLLQVLQDRFGPHIGANPMALLSVIGRNMIGRVQVAPEGASLDEAPAPVDVASLLKGDNSEAAFHELVREHATSGVSGMVPKFLDSSAQRKTTLVSHCHIIKGSTGRLPYISLNEHFCMNVARAVLPTAATRVSDDGNALVVDRFDVDAEGRRIWALEDFCALLGMRPSAKYETTWERVAKAVRNHVAPEALAEAFRMLAGTLLLTYGLRNADCHAKNIALRYSGRADARVAPVFDMVTTVAYHDYRLNPPALSFLGKKTWDPGKNLQNFITSHFGVTKRAQVEMVERMGDAMATEAPRIREAMQRHEGFHEIGKRMLLAWREGLDGLRSPRAYSLPSIPSVEAFEGLSGPVNPPATPRSTGRSELLGKR